MGSNLGDRVKNLETALSKLSENFQLIKSSRIYESLAVGITDQPDFLNSVAEFKIPMDSSPEDCLKILLTIETDMGRVRTQKWGPRIIDLDIIFWGNQELISDTLKIPHPYWCERSFVVQPLRELPYFQIIKEKFNINDQFEIQAKPYIAKDV